MAQKPSSHKNQQVERRHAPRKQVLDTFHVFVAIRKKGLHKIYLRDVSAGGMRLLIEPEDGLKVGETLDCDFHINPTLRLPLRLRVVHVSASSAGCEVVETEPKAYKAFTAFISLLDQLVEFMD